MASERGLPAITLWQPWASLIVPLRVKTIETRGWAAPKRLIGRRIGIHAAARMYGREDVERFADVFGTKWPVLPLGVLLGTVRLAACVPMVNLGSPSRQDRLVLDFPDDGDLPHQQGGMWVLGPYVGSATRVEDQRPFGDFAPGRWAWLLDEITPTTEQCPACGRSAKCGACEGTGSVPVPGGGAACPDCYVATPPECRVCDDYGTCDPIPVRGAQRVWYWRPEEADRG